MTFSGAPPVLAAVALFAGYRTGRRGHVGVVDGVDAVLRAGELVCLLGPNGAGKSTLLRTLVGSQRALSGTVLLAGDDMSTMSARERARRLSVVLTDRIDVGMMTARSLVELGRAPRLGWFNSLDGGDHEVVEWAMRVCGATSLAERQVHELSDGERQRVMIARALAQQPDVLVLDEPTAFLDLTRRVELMALLRRLTVDTGLAVLMSTHEFDLAMRSADAIWLLDPNGSFRCGAPEDLALAGHIATAYASDDVHFDHDLGTFVVPPTGGPARAISITGEAPAVMWTIRAARRAGWQTVAANEAAIHVEVQLHSEAGADEITWRATARDGGAHGRSLAGLVVHLRRHPAPSSAVHHHHQEHRT